MGVTFLIAALEIAGGLVAGSLSLISDALGHAPTHVAAAGLAIASYLVASRRTDAENHRREVRVCQVIAALIFLGAIRIGWEAVERLLSPSPVEGWVVFVIAFLGLIGNFYQRRLLRDCDCEPDLALRDDVRSDIAMSCAVIISGASIGLGAPVVVDAAVSLAAVIWIAVIATRLLVSTPTKSACT